MDQEQKDTATKQDISEDNELETTETKKPKKFYIRNLISTLLIVGGLAIIAIPIVGRIQADRQQEKMMQELFDSIALAQSEASTTEDDLSGLNETLDYGVDENNQIEIDADSLVIDDIFIDEHSADRFVIEFDEEDATEDDVFILETIGAIEIEKLDLLYSIGEGTDLDTLRYSVGHIPSTAAPNTIGNCVLAGHRSHSFGTYFHRLDEMELGDTIEITSMDGTVVTYVVFEKLIVDETDMSVMKNSTDYRVITLITCHPLYQPNPTLRLVLHAIDITQIEAFDYLFEQNQE